MKREYAHFERVEICRPFTGAWIETSAKALWIAGGIGRPFTGAWIETVKSAGTVLEVKSPLHGGVD